jgi:large subunit ribosomal protein L25
MSISLKAEKREQIGSAAAKKIKRAGLIPAVIYSNKGENTNISVSAHDFGREYFKGNILASIIELDLNGKKTKVIAHKVELDPVSDQPVHIDFFNCSETKGVIAKPKLTFINKEKSPGIKKGGFLHVVLRKAEVTCANQNVPSEIIIEADSLHIGSKVRANDITLPEGVKFTDKSNFLIASITGRGKSDEETPAAGAAGTPAAGAAPAADAKKADAKKPEAKK